MKRFLIFLGMLLLSYTGQGQILVAHRGGALIGNENTLSCFEKGIAAGADMIELDVHLTADGEVVVCHDPDLKRTTDTKGAIEKMTLGQFKEARALDRETRKPTEEALPTLAEVFEQFGNRCGILLEIKKFHKGQYEGIEQKCLDLIQKYNLHDRVTMQSFDDSVIEEIHRLDPSMRVEKLIFCRLPFGLCFDGGLRRFSFKKYDYCAGINPMGKLIGKKFIRDAHAAGKTVKIWTVNDPKDAMEGVDGIITNRPDLFLRSGWADRAYWVETLTRIVEPVYVHLSEGTLRKCMTVETRDGLGRKSSRAGVTHLEALGRSFDGMAAWLNLGADETPEGQIRARFIDLACRAIAQAVDPASPDYLPFDGPGAQPLVDAAFFAQGLLRSKDVIWPALDTLTQQRVIKEFKASRAITPYQNNWLLFSATIEAALLEFTGEYSRSQVDEAFRKHDEWYKGDGWYGDGRNFHLDYYNSYVIQPMLLDVSKVLKEHGEPWGEYYDKEVPRLSRYAEQQERMISPEGAYPVLGRSMGYRFGCFQVLSQAAYLDLLPKWIQPSQVRCALTAVLRRQLVPETFDEGGWLTLGFCGHQPTIADNYVSTGSAYLCTFLYIALGLPPEHPFWSGPSLPWSSCNVWSGQPVRADHALKN